MLWDNYTWTFSEIIQLAERVLQFDPNPVFTLDQVPIIGPLYDIARRCRDPFIRREAVRVLYKYPRQEGMYCSALAARAAERLIAVEEKAAKVQPVQNASEVPRWARVTEASPTFHIEGRIANLRYRCFEDEHDLIGKYVEEPLEW